MKSPVLIVEDDAVFRERLAKALSVRGVVVVSCSDGVQALDRTGQGGLGGAVVDLRLPDADGLDLVRQLLDRQRNLPIVLLTGFGSIANALEAVRRGARDYLTKPADPDQILAALRGEPQSVRAVEHPVSEVPSLGRVEWEHIQRVLAECEGNISKTARLLGIDRRSLQRKLAKYPPSK